MEVGAREGFHTHGSDTIVVHLSGGEIEDTAGRQDRREPLEARRRRVRGARVEPLGAQRRRRRRRRARRASSRSDASLMLNQTAPRPRPAASSASSASASASPSSSAARSASASCGRPAWSPASFRTRTGDPRGVDRRAASTRCSAPSAWPSWARCCREAGGYYVYARRAFGDAVGFAVGWTDWLTYCAVLGYVSIAIGEFAAAASAVARRASNAPSRFSSLAALAGAAAGRAARQQPLSGNHDGRQVRARS